MRSPSLAALGALATAAATTRHLVTYVDTAGINWSAQPPTPIVDVAPTAYNVLHAGFFLPSLGKAYDFAATLTNPNPAYGGKLIVDSMHNASKKVILSVGGATETPQSAAYFTKNDPTRLAATLAKLVKDSGIDGVGIDWEDAYDNSNPGLTGYGAASTRKAGSGPAVAWLCTLTKALRRALPSPRYLISHAPQAPYFDLGYDVVHRNCGADIDYYNVQFYNQGNYYVTESGLIDKETIIPDKYPSCVSPWDGSIADIVRRGVPASKIVVGKIITSGDGNSGYVPLSSFASWLGKAVAKYPTLAGAFGWQWGSDTKGAWATTVATAFKRADEALAANGTATSSSVE